jgi:hypothetical protein
MFSIQISSKTILHAFLLMLITLIVYIAFQQIFGPDSRKIGQRDVAVGCNEGPTYDWDAGETVLAHYRMPVLPGEAPGVYPLYIGLYDRADLERAPITGAQGQWVGDMLKLADITLENPAPNEAMVETAK